MRASDALAGVGVGFVGLVIVLGACAPVSSTDEPASGPDSVVSTRTTHETPPDLVGVPDEPPNGPSEAPAPSEPPGQVYENHEFDHDGDDDDHWNCSWRLHCHWHW